MKVKTPILRKNRVQRKQNEAKADRKSDKPRDLKNVSKNTKAINKIKKTVCPVSVKYCKGRSHSHRSKKVRT